METNIEIGEFNYTLYVAGPTMYGDKQGYTIRKAGFSTSLYDETQLPRWYDPRNMKQAGGFYSLGTKVDKKPLLVISSTNNDAIEALYKIYLKNK